MIKPKYIKPTNFETDTISLEIIKNSVLNKNNVTLPGDAAFKLTLSMIERGLFSPSQDEKDMILKIQGEQS